LREFPHQERENTGLEPAGQKEYDRLIRELNQLSEQVPLDAPWTMPQAQQFDTLTVEQWLE
jgi:monoamine oxidase